MFHQITLEEANRGQLPEVYGVEPINKELDEVRASALLHNSYGWLPERIAQATGVPVEQTRSHFHHPYFLAFAEIVYAPRAAMSDYDPEPMVARLLCVGVDWHRIARLFGCSQSTISSWYGGKRRSGAIRTGQLLASRVFREMVHAGVDMDEIAGLHEQTGKASPDVRARARDILLHKKNTETSPIC